MFEKPKDSSSSLKIEETGRISIAKANKLVRESCMIEIYKVVFSIEHNKSPGPDGFPIEFYQRFSDLVKVDLKAMLDGFHREKN